MGAVLVGTGVPAVTVGVGVPVVVTVLTGVGTIAEDVRGGIPVMGLLVADGSGEVAGGIGVSKAPAATECETECETVRTRARTTLLAVAYSAPPSWPLTALININAGAPTARLAGIFAVRAESPMTCAATGDRSSVTPWRVMRSRVEPLLVPAEKATV